MSAEMQQQQEINSCQSGAKWWIFEAQPDV